MANPTALRKICSVINALKRPLKQLHLLAPECCETTDDEGTTDVDMHDNLELDHCIRSVTNLSITVLCRNLIELLSSTSPQLDTLSIGLIQQYDLARLLEPLKGKLASIKRLQLTNIDAEHLLQVTQFLEWFLNVEQLHLNLFTQSDDTEVFSRSAWIRALKRLTKLTELSLYNFGLDFLTKKIALETVGDIESWRQVRKLTLASPDLFLHFRIIHTEPFLPGLKVHHIAHSIGAQFPGLRELNLWSGDGYLHQTVNQTWQELEKNINRALPSLLPAQLMLPPPLRQCQVNVQLRHPVMYSEYNSRPAHYKQLFVEALGRRNLYLSRQSKRLIYHNRSRTMEYVADLFPFVKGNFAVLDRNRVKALMQYYDELRMSGLGAEVNFVDFEDEDEDVDEDEDEDEDEDVDMVDDYEVDENAVGDAIEDVIDEEIESIVDSLVDDMVEEVVEMAEYEEYEEEAEGDERDDVDKHDYDDNFDTELQIFLAFER